MDKSDLRTDVKAILSGMTHEERARKSVLIAKNLYATQYWKGARSVFIFLSLPEEVDTAGIIEKACSIEKLIAIPRVDGVHILFHDCRTTRIFRRSKIGILEPLKEEPSVKPWEIDMPLLVVTPGLAFDRHKHRLGRGRGFYDRFLESLKENPGIRFHSVAICFNEQLFDSIPSSGNDQKVDCVITDHEVVH
jgi:5-formyltetrahydrofolate cyclo-ligase